MSTLPRFVRLVRVPGLALISVLLVPYVRVSAATRNPVPSTNGTSPFIVLAGATTAVTVTGDNFIASSVVLVNGSPVPTTYESSTSVVAQVTLPSATVGYVKLYVQNPAPGGGTSNGWTAAVGAPIATVEAARILDQTTFGPTSALIAHVQQEGLHAWLAEQFHEPQTLLPLVPLSIASDPPGTIPGCDQTVGFCIHSEWWNTALTAPDQIRQRVALALSEIFVISDGKSVQKSIPPYANMLAADAFTNWYQIMTDVTLAGGMGNYLDMLNSGKAPAGQIANENFARENMQLFNLGLYMLNDDGTEQLDSSGNAIPTYTEADVQSFARAYTGWTFANADGSKPSNFTLASNYLHPLVAIESEHDTSEKTLLNGTVLPAGQTAEEDMAGALTNLFNHPNVPPFASKLLIQQLVTGDPSPAYVQRVAKIFENNGNGVRGDMKAVLTAIMTDREARQGDTAPTATSGHLIEPLLWTTHLLRAVGYTVTDPYYINLSITINDRLGEFPYAASSVFNFYPPDYVIPVYGILSPQFNLENTGRIGTLRTTTDALLNNELNGIQINLGANSPLVELAATPASLVDTLGLLFDHGMMDPNVRSVILSEVNSIPATNLAQRARIATYLVVTSGAYKIEN
jgi:hypothetical protein